jgi:CubicO group peptidase (beta-lactamase class C family)
MKIALLLLLLLTPTQRAHVDAVFKQYNALNAPGCALGIFQNDRITYARGYGMADLEHGIRITPASLFDIGSVSKQFAAAAIALLAQQRKLSFADDVHKYIPELPNYGAPLTINELTWHTSGLRDYTSLLDLEGYGLEQATTDQQALAAIVRQRGLDFPSGTQYEYSNTNYFLLSVIVKRVTGQTLAQFARRHIFLPLGMTHTLYRDDYAMLIPNQAMGYAPAGGSTFKNSMSNWQQTGDGAVQISIDDMFKWDENFYHPRVGGAAMLQQLQTPGHLSNGRRLSYGRGLFLETYRGLKAVDHGGAWIGYRAELDRYPTVHTSVAVLCNSDAATPGTLAQKVADVVLARYLAPLPVTSRNARSTVSPRAFAGSYFNALGADVLHIAAHGNGIALDLGGGNLYPLQPTGGSSFHIGTMVLRFVMSKDGSSATGVKIQSGDGSSDYAVKFTPVVPTAAELQGAVGTYHSPELDVTWRLRVDGHTVALEPTRNLPADAAGKLQPQMADMFTSAHGFLIRFTRDRIGRIDGFTVGAGRGLRSLHFTRLQ